MGADCDRDYRTDLPCDVPYVLDGDGECTKTIEEQMAEHGPSRWIYIGYYLTITACSWMMISRDLWLSYKRNHQAGKEQQSFGSFLSKSSDAQMRVGAIVFASFTVVFGIDPWGYGARIPYLEMQALLALQRIALFFAAVLALRVWCEMNLLKKRIQLRRREKVLLAVAVLAVMLLFFLMPMLAVSVLIPEDAPNGVVNAKVFLVHDISFTVVLVLVVSRVTYESYKVTRTLKHGSTDKSIGASARDASAVRTQLITTASAASDAARKDDAKDERRSLVPSTKRAVSEAPGKATPRSGARVHARSGTLEQGSGTLEQGSGSRSHKQRGPTSSTRAVAGSVNTRRIKIFIGGLWVGLVFAFNVVAMSIKSYGHTCWYFQEPPDEQFFTVQSGGMLFILLLMVWTGSMKRSKRVAPEKGGNVKTSSRRKNRSGAQPSDRMSLVASGKEVNRSSTGRAGPSCPSST